jgi:hypothetical protein
MEFEQKENKRYDFSRTAVKKAVLRSSVEHPSVVYPAALGIVGLLGVGLLGGTTVLLGMLIGGAGIAGLSWINQYWLRNDYLSNLYVNRLLEDINRQQKEKISAVKASLEKLDAADAYRQLERLQEKYRTFHHLVDHKFHTGELIHARFNGVLEQVFLGTIDNLQKLAHLLQSNQAIDIGFIQQRLDKLLPDITDPEVKREISTLQSRLDLYNDQGSKIKSLMIDNEEAMTQMDLTMHALSEAEGIDQQATIDLESAIDELQHLATRARKY